MSKRVVIIGAGASGMTAAVFAARQGANVTLIEHTDRLGKKILSTGNGKCNLSNVKMDESCYRSGRAEFPMEVISQFGTRQTVEFFDDLGIVVKDRNGYLYPHSGQASSVQNVLCQELLKRKVHIVTECLVERIHEHVSGLKEFQVLTDKGCFCADAVILATGSKAAPNTGSDGSGYALAEGLGLSVVKPLPALVQLRCREKFYKQIAGVRVDGVVKLFAEGKKVAEDRGELQLTDYGISGIPVFQVSRYAARALDAGKKVEAVLDLHPDLSFEETKLFLNSRFARDKDKAMGDFFTGWFNDKLAALFLKLARIERTRAAKSVSERERVSLLALIKEFHTDISAVNPFASAQICCGGVDVEQVDSETMEVKNRKGLYLVGELLDVDGICGGYNLQWAWSTGAIAGTHAGL